MVVHQTRCLLNVHLPAFGDGSASDPSALVKPDHWIRPRTVFFIWLWVQDISSSFNFAPRKKVWFLANKNLDGQNRDTHPLLHANASTDNCWIEAGHPFPLTLHDQSEKEIKSSGPILQNHYILQPDDAAGFGRIMVYWEAVLASAAFSSRSRLFVPTVMTFSASNFSVAIVNFSCRKMNRVPRMEIHLLILR